MINLSKRFLGLKTSSPKRQEALLRLCLTELNRKVDYSINHDTGVNIIESQVFGILYPLSFFLKADTYSFNQEKRFYASFQGFIDLAGGRLKMLKPFMNRNDCLIINDNYGRNVLNKFKFNDEYFKNMSMSRYVLCPHHVNWKGDIHKLWTYRFLEAIIAKSIPVVFRETPLSIEFTNGFDFFYDDQIPTDLSDEDYNEIVNKNYRHLLLNNSTITLMKHNASKSQ